MVDLVEQARLVTQTDASVLLTGETGTGKDLLARHIHLSGPRNKNLFVKVNCPALSTSLFESELFGHSKGAFTGADKARVGRFEMAAGGTIFLDEIGELSVQLQAKMLQVLQDRSFERLGESRAIKTDLRIIAASNRDLEQAVKEGRFRQDLYYRLNAMRFHLPPLRERPLDIPLLLKKLTETESRRMNRPEPLYSPSAVELILAYQWPGNVRELKNLIMRLVIMRAGQTIAADDIQGLLAANPSSPPQGRVLPLAEMERRLLEQALTQCRGVLGGAQGAAKLLGVPRSTLQYRIKKHTLDLAQFRK